MMIEYNKFIEENGLTQEGFEQILLGWDYLKKNGDFKKWLYDEGLVSYDSNKDEYYLDNETFKGYLTESSNTEESENDESPFVEEEVDGSSEPMGDNEEESDDEETSDDEDVLEEDIEEDVGDNPFSLE